MPSRLDETICFNLRLREIRNSAFVIEHDITCGAEKRLFVIQSLVFVSLDDLRPVPVTEDLRVLMLEFLITEQPSGGGQVI